MTPGDDQTGERDLALDMDLMAYVDGTLDPDRIPEIEARLATDPDAREAVAQWRHFGNVIRDAAQQADTRPDNLQIAALERKLASRLSRRRWRNAFAGPGLRRVAASAVIFAAGWWTHGLLGPGSGPHAYPEYVASTISGHAAYQLAAYQSAEFSGAEMTEALAWLSERMQRKIENPKLETLGYTVESARLIERDDRPVAVFYYRDRDDRRITVSISPRAATDPGEDFRIARTETGQLAYWSSDSLHYAVIGSVDTADMTTLAAAIAR